MDLLQALEQLKAAEPGAIDFYPNLDDEAYMILAFTSGGITQTIWINTVPELMHYAIAQGVVQELAKGRSLLFKVENDTTGTCHATVREVDGLVETATDEEEAIALLTAYLALLSAIALRDGGGQ